MPLSCSNSKNDKSTAGSATTGLSYHLCDFAECFMEEAIVVDRIM